MTPHGSQLKAWRTRQNLTQWELAQTLGVSSPQVISQWEHGKHQISRRFLAKLRAAGFEAHDHAEAIE